MNEPRISLIAALSENRVIGINNALPWHIPGDLKRFKDLTSGHPIVMGRKTFESLGRVLPNRTNIVITHDVAKFNEEAKKAGLIPQEVVASLDEAIEKAKESFGGEEEVFIIGGGQIFSQAIAQADRLYLTIVHTTILGDAYFPEYDMFTKEIERKDEKGEEFDYTYLTLER